MSFRMGNHGGEENMNQTKAFVWQYRLTITDVPVKLLPLLDWRCKNVEKELGRIMQLMIYGEYQR